MFLDLEDSSWKNYFVSLASNTRINVSNKAVYVVVSDSYKNVRHRGTTRTVGIAAEIPFPKIFVEMIKALQSGMME